MTTRSQVERPGWFLPLRLATYIILFAVVVFWMDYPSYLRGPFIAYSVITLALAIIVGTKNRKDPGTLGSVTLALQFLFEIVIESGIVFATGNVNSPFFTLFLLTIVSASLAYRLVGTLMIASLASLADAFIIWLVVEFSGSPGPASQGLHSLLTASESVFYSVFLHILIFYLVAFISGFLAERLRVRDQQLADTSRALRMARLETDDILRHLNSGLLTVDADGKIIYFNRAAERILGYREPEVRGMSCEDVFSQRMPSLAEALMDGVDRGHHHPRKEISILNADRERVPVGLSTSRLLDDRHTPRGVIAIFSDLTDAKRMEDKVRAADRLAAVGELSASIAHEIRNPLAAISGSVEVLKSELQVEGENCKLMDLIVKESDRLSKITTEFLQYARIDRPTYEKVELCHLINEIIQVLHHHQAFRSDIQVALITDEAIVYVVGEEDLLKQLLLNLAVNACESFDDEPHSLSFSLVVKQAQGKVQLFVEDDGPGIDAENLGHIYRPFFSTKKEGTGLGLAIVHRICNALKLDIQVDSEPGRGTAFVIEFDAYNHERVEDSSEKSEAASPVATT